METIEITKYEGKLARHYAQEIKDQLIGRNSTEFELIGRLEREEHYVIFNEEYPDGETRANITFEEKGGPRVWFGPHYMERIRRDARSPRGLTGRLGQKPATDSGEKASETLHHSEQYPDGVQGTSSEPVPVDWTVPRVDGH